MKEYPSIPRLIQPPNIPAYTFTKYDGSSLRFAWSPKKGWYKFGTRHRLFDKTDKVFGESIGLFKKTLAEDILHTLKPDLPKGAEFICYCEYLGPHSFAGHHINEPKELKLFDININKYGFVSPKDFVELFGAKPYSAQLLTYEVVDDKFVEDVRNFKWNTPQNPEGVICKWGHRHTLEMLKIKTYYYLDKLKQSFGEDWNKYE